MPLDGDFHTMSPSELLQWISLAEKTGTLAVRSGETMLRLTFIGGRIGSSASTDPRHHLSAYLVENGFINEQERQKLMDAQDAARMSLGRILLEIGAIGEDELLALMRAKAQEEVCEMLEWREAEFAFVADQLPDIDFIPLSIDAMSMVMENSRRRDEARQVELDERRAADVRAFSEMSGTAPDDVALERKRRS